MPRHPIVTVVSAMKLLGTTKPTAGKAVDGLVAAGVTYRAYLDGLKVGTDLMHPAH